MSNEKRVVCLDDSRSVRLLLRAIFAGTSYRLLELDDGADPLVLVWRERPDVVVLDVAVWGLDGYELCRTLKSDPDTADIVVVMLTGRAQRADRERGLAAGADAYITKPFSPGALLERLNWLTARTQSSPGSRRPSAGDRQKSGNGAGRQR